MKKCPTVYLLERDRIKIMKPVEYTNKAWYNIGNNTEETQNRSKFMIEIRQVPFLASKLDGGSHGFNVADVDGVIWHYKINDPDHSKLMLVETKTFNDDVEYGQRLLLERQAKSVAGDPYHLGVFVIIFEGEGPSDGMYSIKRYNVEKKEWTPIKFTVIEDGEELHTYRATGEQLWRWIEKILQ